MTRETDDVGDDAARARSNATREGARGACAGTVARGDAPDGYGQGARAGSRAREGELGERGWRGLHGGSAPSPRCAGGSGRISSGTRAGNERSGSRRGRVRWRGCGRRRWRGGVHAHGRGEGATADARGAGGDGAGGTYRNWTHAIRTIAREEGVRGLFRGYWAQNFVWWPWSAAYL